LAGSGRLPAGVEAPELEGAGCRPAGAGAWTFEARVERYIRADDEEETPEGFEGGLFVVFRTLGRASAPIRVSDLGIEGPDQLTTSIEIANVFD
jgi:hypothetical protein